MGLRKKESNQHDINVSNWLNLENIFLLGCIAATVSLQIICIQHYFRDEDVSMVHYTKFHSTDEAVYPSISFCILPPFLESKFDAYGNGINQTSYKQFLQGDFWDEKMLNVDYDNVTVSLSDNLLGSYYVTQKEKQHAWNPEHHVSFRSSNRKCFTVDAPAAEGNLLWFFGMYINNNIFPDGKRSPTNRVFLYFHYPGQRFTAYYTVKTEWGSRRNKSLNYEMSFNVKNIDLITNRNKGKERCVRKWKEFDQHIMDDIIVQTGCRPPHWRTTLNLPICRNATQMKIFSRQPSTAKVEMYDPPCKVVERLDYIYHEKDENRDFK